LEPLRATYTTHIYTKHTNTDVIVIIIIIIIIIICFAQKR